MNELQNLATDLLLASLEMERATGVRVEHAYKIPAPYDDRTDEEEIIDEERE